MKNFIIDAAGKDIFFSVINESESYTTTYTNSRENFDNFMLLILDFFKKNEIKLNEIQNIFINQGPGSFSGIRVSLSIAKGISLFNNIELFGFYAKDIVDGNYTEILKLHKKDLLIKGLIKPLYSS